jgi:iron complex transport system substrate-binding protein
MNRSTGLASVNRNVCRRSLALACALLALVVSGCGRPERAQTQKPAAASTAAAGRIISMAPSITETLFALGLQERLVGVTTFCDYPPEARTIAKIGGYVDPNYEAMVRLKPDLVILFPEHHAAAVDLASLGLKSLTVDHNSVQDVLASIGQIGAIAGVGARADSLTADLTGRMDRIAALTRDLPRPRVLVSIGRNMGTGTLKDLYICGQDRFYDTLLTLAGGVNAYQGASLKYPMISAEGILRLNPEVIIDMVPDLQDRGWREQDVVAEWQSLRNVDAVRNGRIHVLGQDFVATPGPRFVAILELMVTTLHPELAAEADR